MGEKAVHLNLDTGSLFETVFPAVHFFEDPLTGMQTEIVSYIPDLSAMDPEELILLLQYLQWHTQCTLQNERPKHDPCLLRIWKERNVQSQRLTQIVKNYLINSVFVIRKKNCGYIRHFRREEFIRSNLTEICPTVGLKQPEEFILYRYAYDAFPRWMSRDDQQKVYRELCKRLETLGCLEAEDGDTFRGYCCDQLKEQIKYFHHALKQED